MFKSTLEKLPLMVKEGQITDKEGEKKLLEIIFKNKNSFTLASFNEDDLSDFLIHLMGQIKKIFIYYNPEKSKFYTYLVNCIKKTKCNFFKNKYLNEVNSQFESTENKKIFESDCERYEMSENQWLCASSENEESFLVKNTGKNKTYDIKEFLDEISAIKLNSAEGKKKIKKAAAFYLALKCSYHLDSTLINKISDYCHISKENLLSIVNKLNAQLTPKIEKRKHLLEMIDNDFFKRQKYLSELGDCKNESLLTIKRKLNLEKINNRWFRHKEEYVKTKGRTNVSTEAISKVTGIKPRHIRAIIKYYSNKMDKKEEKE
jgi:hypothetical protein